MYCFLYNRIEASTFPPWQHISTFLVFTILKSAFKEEIQWLVDGLTYISAKVSDITYQLPITMWKMAKNVSEKRAGVEFKVGYSYKTLPIMRCHPRQAELILLIIYVALVTILSVLFYHFAKEV